MLVNEKEKTEEGVVLGTVAEVLLDVVLETGNRAKRTAGSGDYTKLQRTFS